MPHLRAVQISQNTASPIQVPPKGPFQLPVGAGRCFHLPELRLPLCRTRLVDLRQFQGPWPGQVCAYSERTCRNPCAKNFKNKLAPWNACLHAMPQAGLRWTCLRCDTMICSINSSVLMLFLLFIWLMLYCLTSALRCSAAGSGTASNTNNCYPSTTVTTDKRTKWWCFYDKFYYAATTRPLLLLHILPLRLLPSCDNNTSSEAATLTKTTAVKSTLRAHSPFSNTDRYTVKNFFLRIEAQIHHCSCHLFFHSF